MASRESFRGRDTIRKIVARAVQKARIPGQGSLGTTPNRSTGLITPDIDGGDYVPEDGTPVRTALTEVDFTDDERRLTI